MSWECPRCMVTFDNDSSEDRRRFFNEAADWIEQAQISVPLGVGETKQEAVCQFAAALVAELRKEAQR